MCLYCKSRSSSLTSSTRRQRRSFSRSCLANVSQTNQTRQWRNGTRVSLPGSEGKQRQRQREHALMMELAAQPNSLEMVHQQTRRQAHSSTLRILCTAKPDQDQRTCVMYQRSKLAQTTTDRSPESGTCSNRSAGGVVCPQDDTKMTAFRTKTPPLSQPIPHQHHDTLSTNDLNRLDGRAPCPLQTPTRTNSRPRGEGRLSFVIEDHTSLLSHRESTSPRPILSNTESILSTLLATGLKLGRRTHHLPFLFTDLPSPPSSLRTLRKRRRATITNDLRCPQEQASDQCPRRTFDMRVTLLR